MDTYTIKKAYPAINSTEIEISSENLLYAELGVTHSGCQCMNTDNQHEIHEKCKVIAQLIREIDELNKK